MQSLVGEGPAWPGPARSRCRIAACSSWTRRPVHPDGRALDALRQPLESGHVVIARAQGVNAAARGSLMALAANPCALRVSTAPWAGVRRVHRPPCGGAGPALRAADRLRWTSGSRWTPSRAANCAGYGPRGDSTQVVADRSAGSARERAARTVRGHPVADPAARCRGTRCARDGAAPGALDEAELDLERGFLTARGLDRVLRVAWTVADLAGQSGPSPERGRSRAATATEDPRAGVPIDDRGRLKLTGWASRTKVRLARARADTGSAEARRSEVVRAVAAGSSGAVETDAADRRGGRPGND
ncbi:ATP-binding protein [Streptomyces sp. KL116D]|uniref:magnesium chelatase subunit ChlI family protein n=1 Tax=Streptomyces sp. KL116D TaxID=3045152 RepID=UPI0035569977